LRFVRHPRIESVACPQLARSTLVGVIHFSQAAADFRGHRIPAGFYTLRYELMPNDGNHLGAAPNRDFLLVVPAASDGDPGATFKELATMSARTTGTKHPSPLSLVQADAEPSTPAVSNDDQDHRTFSGGMRLSSGRNFPLRWLWNSATVVAGVRLAINCFQISSNRRLQERRIPTDQLRSQFATKHREVLRFVLRCWECA
jgi:hypothetical protein